MNQTRTWVIGAAAVMALILVAGFVLLIQPQRSEAADLQQQTQAQEEAKQQLDNKLKVLKQQQAGLPAQEAQLAALGKQIPSDPQLPSVIRSITEIGDRTGVQVTKLSPGAIADVATVKVAAGAAAGSVKSNAESTAGGAASSTPVAPVSTDVLQQIPLTIEATGSYAEVTKFLDEIEDLTRPFLVTQVTVDNQSPLDGKLPPGVHRLNLTASIFLTGPSTNPATTTAQPSAAGNTATAE